MKSKLPWILLAVVAMGVGIGANLLFSPAPSAPEGQETSHAPVDERAGTEGTQAPDFSLPALRGSEKVTLSDYRGNVVLVNFWATWCPPCREEIPAFIQVRNSLHAEGFEIIGVALDDAGASVVLPFAQEFAISYPLALGDQAVTRLYGGIRGIPASFLVDRQGKIVQKYVGAIDAQTLENAVRSVL